MTTNVYQAIAGVSKDLAQIGISKDSRNAAQGFNFRGIDAVYNALAPLLAKHNLCILPRCIGRSVTERTNAKGTAMFYVTVHAEFDFVSAEDGSKHTVSTYGEAMDSGDKATNKAMSAAYKYAAFQTFCIPTEETAVDADSETHEVKSGPINEMQVDELNELLDQTGSNKEAFCGYYKINSVPELPASSYQHALHALQSKLKKAA